ncbi:MAG: HNH endonuclease [Terriglobales bacterium]
MTKSRHINRPRFRWTMRQLWKVWREYPHRPTAAIAAEIGCRIQSVYQKAAEWDLHKSVAFNASPASGRNVKGHAPHGMRTRFQKGITPANKGLRRPGWARGRMRETQFKKGELNGVALRRYKPVGSHRVNADGYLDRKVCDDGLPHRRWVGVHRLVWIESNGPIPSGHIIRFNPGRRTTDLALITPDALECITLRENRLRNSIHQVMAPELRQITLLRGQITRLINRRLRDAKDDRRSARAPVRHARRASRRKEPDGHRAGQGSG